MSYNYTDFHLSDYEIEKIKLFNLQSAINDELRTNSIISDTILVSYSATQNDIERRRRAWYAYYLSHGKLPQNILKPTEHIPKINYSTFAFEWPDNIFGNFSNPGLDTADGRVTVNSIYEAIKNWELLDENTHLTITNQTGFRVDIQSLASNLELENGEYHVSGWVGRPYDEYYMDNNNGTIVHDKALCQVNNDFTIDDNNKKISLHMNLRDYIITSNHSFSSSWYYDISAHPTWLAKDFYSHKGVKYQFISINCNIRERKNIVHKEAKSFHCSVKLPNFIPNSVYFNTITEGESCYLIFNFNPDLHNYTFNAFDISLETMQIEHSTDNQYGELVKGAFSKLILESLLNTDTVNITLKNTTNNNTITITDLNQTPTIPSGIYNVTGFIGRENNDKIENIYEKCKLVTNCQITVVDGTKPKIPFILDDGVIVSERPFTCEEKYDSRNTSSGHKYYNQTQTVEPFKCGDYYYMFLTNNSRTGIYYYVTIKNRIYHFNIGSTEYTYDDSGTVMGKFYYYNPQ